jgi:hypothetical protein
MKLAATLSEVNDIPDCGERLDGASVSRLIP